MAEPRESYLLEVTGSDGDTVRTERYFTLEMLFQMWPQAERLVGNIYIAKRSSKLSPDNSHVDPRWFDKFTLSGKDVCALVQAGSNPRMLGMKILDHPEVEKILKGKHVER